MRFKIELAIPVLRQASERLWCHPEVRRLYPSYLLTMHGIVRSAVPLIETALERARALAPTDAVASGLMTYLAAHAIEERGHDQWVLDDLGATGIDPLLALERIPSSKVATLVGAQYYWLRHVHPVSLLGHMAVVEGHAPQSNFAERLRKVTGYPPDAFRTIERHAHIDLNHARDLYALIDSLPLEPRHETLMGISALHTVQAAIDVFEEILGAPSPSPVPEFASQSRETDNNPRRRNK